MCRHLSREEQIEGWRALGELLPKPKLGLVGDFMAAFVRRLKLAAEPAKRPL